ncbi:MAG: hypothetical protein A2Y10_11165 [Planctomycetes bacterium GWF2_41_51]|nr:MAG: hypothetical protein A2Y10_11165 [Planctomycetes bacterium GWF2_41_51]
MKKSKILLVTVLVLATMFMFFSIWAMHSRPVSTELVSRIVEGMSKEEVQTILGHPNNINYNENSEQWTYGSGLQWNFYRVTFSKNGKVLFCEMDD